MRSSRGSQSKHPHLTSVPAAQLKGHTGSILDVKFTKNGRYVLTCGQDRTVRLWNPTRLDPAIPSQRRCAYAFANDEGMYGSVPVDALPQALPISTYHAQHMYEVSSVAIDDGNKCVISSSNKAVFVSDVMTSKLLRRFDGHEGRVNSVACNADASVVLSGSYDGTVKCWDVRNNSNSSTPIQVLDEATDSVTSVFVTNDQYEIITTSVDSKLRTYDLRKGQLRVDHLVEAGSALTSVALSNDSQCLIVNCLDGIVRLVERSNGNVIGKYSNSHQAKEYSVGVDITADDQYIVCGSEDGKVALYELIDSNANSSAIQTLDGHTRPTCAVAACPSRNNVGLIVSASYDGNAVVWSTPDDVLKWDKD